MNEERIQARERANQLAQEFRQKGDLKGWFDAVYANAKGNPSAIPWAHLTPNPLFTDWSKRNDLKGEGKKALLVGCGLGDDAEELARLGFEVTAFDISPNAIEWCRRRFPQSKVDYCIVDLLTPPATWQSKFDFVLECYTLQALPIEVRGQAIENIARFPSPGGSLLVICRGCDTAAEQISMPWPLTRDELAGFQKSGLQLVSFEDFMDDEDPPVRRFRILYQA